MNYPEAAYLFELDLCQHCAVFDHERGRLEWHGDIAVIHWRDRPINVVSLRRFLLLAARGMNPSWEGRENWERLWQANVVAGQLALTHFHRRIPRHLAETDRARMRYLLRSVPDWQRRHWDTRTQTAFRRATRWAWEA